jgi:hypothetical protein
MALNTLHHDERREHARYDTLLVMNIDTETRKDRFGLAINASAGGALFKTPSHFAVGDRMTLTLLLPRRLAIIANAEVVRTMPLRAVMPWRFVVAVRFDESLPLLPDVLGTMAARSRSSLRAAAPV